MSYLNMEEEKIREYMEKVAGGYSDPLVGLFRMKLRGHKDYFENELKEKRLIDLGCGKIFGCGLGRTLLARGLREYIGVDPFNVETHSSGENDSYVRADGLSYLLAQPDNSALIMANAVLDTGILRGRMNSFLEPISVFERKDELAGEYEENLTKEIYRVVPKNGIFMGLKVYPHYANRLISLGFEMDEQNPTFSPFEEDRKDPDNYSVLVLRKK